MVSFITGRFVGALSGLVAMSLLAVGRDSDLRLEIAGLQARLKKSLLQYQALVLADDFYSEMTYRKNRIRQLQFELQYIDNDFTTEWSAEERKEIIDVCEEMLEQIREDYIANLDEEGHGAESEGRTAISTWQPSMRLVATQHNAEPRRELADAL
jgi:hypothetical protein